MLTTKILASTLSLLAVTACGKLADDTYQGEPLATLRGTMDSTALETSVHADVSVVWVIGDGGLSLVGADHVEVEGSLPSNFEISVFTPPTDDMMFDMDGVKYGAAYIVSTPPGEDPQDWEIWLGAVMDHVLIYLPASPPAGSTVAALLRGTPTPGFHIYAVHHITEEERQARLACASTLGREASITEVIETCGGTGNDDLLPAADDLNTQLALQLVGQFGLEHFNALPSWYGL